jgi:AraC-like DNA-binding protein
MNSFYYYTLLLLFFLSGACSQQMEEEAVPPMVRYTGISDSSNISYARYDSLFHHHYYLKYPDSAEYYSLKAIERYKKEGRSNLVLAIYTDLAELYQYRFPNDYKAILCYAEALRILSEHPEQLLGNPFYYIDMGNIFYRYKLYDYALNSYRRSLSSAITGCNSYAAAVALNNIGLTFQKNGSHDSASCYFHQSLMIRKKLLPVLAAQNYGYLAELMIDCRQTDSVLFYVKCSQQLTAIPLKLPREYPGISLKMAQLLLSEVQNSLWCTLARFYETSNPDSAIHYNKLVICSSLVLGNPKLIADAYIRSARLETGKQPVKIILCYLDSALRFANKTMDFKKLTEAHRLIADVFIKSEDPERAIRHLRLSSEFADSTRIRENSHELLADKIRLITHRSEEELKLLRTAQRQSDLRIQSQYLLIGGLSLLVLTIVAALFFVFLQKKKLERANKILVSKTVELINCENRKPMTCNKNVENMQSLQLQMDLEQLMNVEALYNQPDLTLSELAVRLKTNTSYLSHCINQHMKCNFSDYINQLRVKEACRMIAQMPAARLSIDQVASKVGFNSKSAFYTAFKKFTGVTPACFQKNVAKS